MKKNLLRSILAGESRAYGFTISFWGSGALLINSFGIPSVVEIFLYGFGAVTGFGIITLYAYRRAFGDVDYEQPEYLVFSMIHYISAIVPVGITYLFTATGKPGLAFFLSGASVSITYNLAMLVEETLSEKARKLEEKLVNP